MEGEQSRGKRDFDSMLFLWIILAFLQGWRKYRKGGAFGMVSMTRRVKTLSKIVFRFENFENRHRIEFRTLDCLQILRIFNEARHETRFLKY